MSPQAMARSRELACEPEDCTVVRALVERGARSKKCVAMRPRSKMCSSDRPRGTVMSQMGTVMWKDFASCARREASRVAGPRWRLVRYAVIAALAASAGREAFYTFIPLLMAEFGDGRDPAGRRVFAGERERPPSRPSRKPRIERGAAMERSHSRPLRWWLRCFSSRFYHGATSDITTPWPASPPVALAILFLLHLRFSTVRSRCAVSLRAATVKQATSSSSALYQSSSARPSSESSYHSRGGSSATIMATERGHFSDCCYGC